MHRLVTASPGPGARAADGTALPRPGPARAGWSQPRLDQGPVREAGHSLARTGAHTADGRALGLGQHSEAGAACRRPADSPVRVQAGRQREWHWRGFEVLMPEEAPAQMHFTFFFLSGKKSPTRTHLQKREQYTFSGLQIRILTKGHKLESAKDSEVPLKTVGEMWV